MPVQANYQLTTALSLKTLPAVTMKTLACSHARVASTFRPFTAKGPSTGPIRCIVRAQQPDNEPNTSQRVAPQIRTSNPVDVALFTSMALLMAAEPALADVLEPTNPFNTVASNSLYVTLALFLMSVPGIWSQIKRAPAANKKRKTYEVAGPAVEGAVSLKERAKQIMTYFKKYNYEVKEMGEVITFAGLYKANSGQAAAVTFYTFVGMASVALVMSLLVPEVGNWWYLLTLTAPAAWAYYFRKADRIEEVRVKMATADDEKTTDITIEGDIEEIERFRKELNLIEKGMVPVKGLLEA